MRPWPLAALALLAATRAASAQFLNLAHPKALLPTSGVNVANDRIRLFFDRVPAGQPDAGRVRLRTITDLDSDTEFDWTSTGSLIDVNLKNPACNAAPVQICGQTKEQIAVISMIPDHVTGPVEFAKWTDNGVKYLQIYWTGARPDACQPWTAGDTIDVTLEVRIPDGDSVAEWRVGVDIHSSTFDLKRVDSLFDYHQFGEQDKVLAPSFNGQIYTNLAGNIKTDNLLDMQKGHFWRKFAPLYAFWSPEVEDRGVGIVNRDPTGFHAEACFLDDVPGHSGVVRMLRGHHGHDYTVDFPPPTGTKQHRAAYPLAISTFEGGVWGVVEQTREWLLTTSMTPALTLDVNPDLPEVWRRRPILFIQNVGLSDMASQPGLPAAFAALRDKLVPPSLIGPDTAQHPRRAALFQWSWAETNWDPIAQAWTSTAGQGDDSYLHYVMHPSAQSFLLGLDAQSIDTGVYSLSFAGSVGGPNSAAFPAHAVLGPDCQPTALPPSAPELYLMRSWDPWYHALYTSLMQTVQAQAGIDFVYFDNPWMASGDRQRIGDQAFEGFYDLMEAVRAGLRVQNPDAMVTFEAFHPMYSQLLLSQTIGADERPPDSWMNNAEQVSENFPLLEALLGDRVLFTLGGQWGITSPFYTQPLLQLGSAGVDEYGEGILANIAGSFRWGRMLNHGELISDPNFWVDNFWTSVSPSGGPAQAKLDAYIEFVGKLAAVRSSEASKFLVGGQLVRPPALSGDGAQPRTFDYYQIDAYHVDLDGDPLTDERPYSLTYPTLMSSMWKGVDGTLGLMLINYNMSAESITWSVDPESYGLPASTRWVVRALDSSCPGTTADDMRFELTDLDPLASNQVTIPPESVAFYEIRADDVPNAGEGAVTAQFSAGDLDGLTVAAGAGTHSIANGKLSSSGENVFLTPGCKRGELSAIVDVARQMPIGAKAGVIVNAESEASSFDSGALQSMVYVERTSTGLLGQVWIGDGTTQHVGALVPNSAIDPSQSGFRLRVELDDGVVRAWLTALTNPLGPEIPLLVPSGSSTNGFDVPAPADGGWTMLYANTLSGAVGLDNVLIRNANAIPDIHRDSSGRVWLSLVRPGIGLELASGTPEFEFEIGGQTFDWAQFNNAFVPSVFAWSTLDANHAVLVRNQVSPPFTGTVVLSYDGQITAVEL
jgi:hypothetical protein